ncbi:MAG: ATP-binding protein [Theionarchaea archaeon]|nr:ATP-binding protein [Theionarchaea archaeon]
MIQQFVNREAELKFLEKKYSEDSAQMIIIYGRRRVGKTELIKKFIQKKYSLYVLCTRDSLAENIKELKTKFCELTKKEYFLKLESSSYAELLKYLLDEIENEKLVLAFDEFPYLIEMEKGITSVFQKMWDELLKDRNVLLILCGSSIRMMETEILGYKSPLYGRRTGEWKVEPFVFRDIVKMFTKFSLEECMKLYSVFGGIPFYLAQIDQNISVEENIKKKILSKGEILYNEPKIVMRQEFREPRTYTLILKYLSLGYNRHGELASVTGIEKGNLSKYLSVLEETRLIEYILPLGKRKRGIYRINDTFFNFWFRFVYPHLSDLELGLVDEVFLRIQPQLNAFYGLMYEQLILDLIRTKSIQIPFSTHEVRRWWHKDKEIDVVALNTETKEILFAEGKWKDEVNAEKIVVNLKEKAQHVRWFNTTRKEYFAIFAKSFSNRPGDCLCFDLKDLEKMKNRIE